METGLKNKISVLFVRKWKTCILHWRYKSRLGHPRSAGAQSGAVILC